MSHLGTESLLETLSLINSNPIRNCLQLFITRPIILFGGENGNSISSAKDENAVEFQEMDLMGQTVILENGLMKV